MLASLIAFVAYFPAPATNHLPTQSAQQIFKFPSVVYIWDIYACTVHRITKILISLYNLFSIFCSHSFFVVRCFLLTLLPLHLFPSPLSVYFLLLLLLFLFGFWLLRLVFVFACGQARNVPWEGERELWPLCCRCCCCCCCCNCYFTFVHSHANQYNFVTTAQRHGQHTHRQFARWG